MAEYLNTKEVPCVHLREPTNGVWGQKIREILTVGRGSVTVKRNLLGLLKIVRKM